MEPKKNSKKGNFIYGIIGLVAIVFLLIGAYFLLRYLVGVISSYSPETNAVVITGLLTSFGGIIAIIFTKHREKKLQIEQEHRKQTAEIYTEYIKFVFSLINQERINRPVSDKEKIRFMSDFYAKLIVWGSEEIIKEFNFQKSLVDKGGVELALGFGRMLLLIRKELGHKNKDLSEVDLLSVIVKDLDLSKLTMK